MKGPANATKQVMLNRLLQSPTFAGVAERAFIGDLKQVTAFLADPDIKERVLQRTVDEVERRHEGDHRSLAWLRGGL